MSRARPLHFLQRPECVNALDFARLDLLHPPLNLIPEPRVERFGVFLFMNGRHQVLVEHKQVLQRQLSNLLLSFSPRLSYCSSLPLLSPRDNRKRKAALQSHGKPV